MMNNKKQNDKRDILEINDPSMDMEFKNWLNNPHTIKYLRENSRENIAMAGFIHGMSMREKMREQVREQKELLDNNQEELAKLTPEKQEMVLNKINELITNQKNLDPKYSDIINKHFWDLL